MSAPLDRPDVMHPVPAPGRARPHWIVATHHRMRSLSFAYAFLFLGLFGLDHGWAPWVWALLVAQFLVYPHLLYWRAVAARVPQRAELHNLVLDAALLGLWSGGMGLPLWITFTLFITGAVNNAISRGTRGLMLSIPAFAGGAIAVFALAGWPGPSAESHWVSLLCVIGVSAYLLGIGLLAFSRTMALRNTHELLRNSEAALRQANDDMQAQLVQIRDLQGQLEFQAWRDPLTTLFNRRYFLETAQRELAHCRRDQRPLSLIVLDVDHFKAINDRFGHTAGDEVLKALAGLIGTSVREGDVPCRMGGEEFALLLPDMTVDVAWQRAEQLRRACSQMQVPGVAGAAGPIGTTVSIGIATFDVHGDDIATLLHHADLALYAAKRGGRDRVLVFAPQMLADHAGAAAVA